MVFSGVIIETDKEYYNYGESIYVTIKRTGYIDNPRLKEVKLDGKLADIIWSRKDAQYYKISYRGSIERDSTQVVVEYTKPFSSSIFGDFRNIYFARKVK